MGKNTFLFLLLSLFFFSCSSVEKQLTLHMIDVGEGDSFLIETPKGETILIDAGNPVTGYKVAQYLKKHQIQTIDHLIFSHPDQDHIGGNFFVRQMFDVKKP